LNNDNSFIPYDRAFFLNRLRAISLLVLLTFPRVLAAQAIPGRWEKVDGLTRGSSITVVLTTGNRAEYTFVSSSPELLIVNNEDGKEIQFAKSDVRAIERQRRDRVRNGVLIGTGVGFGAGFFALAARLLAITLVLDLLLLVSVH
jgi:hypothetical protein